MTKHENRGFTKERALKVGNRGTHARASAGLPARTNTGLWGHQDKHGSLRLLFPHSPKYQNAHGKQKHKCRQKSTFSATLSSHLILQVKHSKQTQAILYYYHQYRRHLESHPETHPAKNQIHNPELIHSVIWT